jgi:pimeloyl-ACP methyl ester carboxylesterase
VNYQIQGLSIHAEVHGTAEPALVFLHYWGGTSRTWHIASRRPEGLSGLILVAPAQPTPRRNPEEMRQGQLHETDERRAVRI